MKLRARDAFIALTILMAADYRISEAASPLAVHVQNNHLVDANGNVFRLLGVNRSGSEYACEQSWGFFDGPVDDTAIAAIKAWNTNAVRVPLNEDCWLGINLPASNPYIGSAYQQAIVAFVQRLNNAGLYVILDLHWNAPGTNVANGQRPMADLDHSPAFWSSVATIFKNFPAVVFDLYNEPYVSTWDCWRNGCTVSTSDGTWSTAGMTQLVAAVRGAGATQPIMLGGLGYAGDLSQWLANAPADSLNPPQLVASFHTYCQGNTVAACQSSLADLQTNQWPTVATVANSVPVVTGEFGEYECATTYVNPYMTFADSHGISYLGWAWDPYDCGSFPALIVDYTGTPTAYGMGLKSHLAAVRSMRGAHDFNGDYRSDVLWYNTASGQAAMWLMSGTSVIGGGSPGSAGSPWAIVGQRDFNGDGYADIVWRNGTSGQVVIWLLNGTSMVGAGSPGTVTTDWTIAGTGDFNGDGMGDILWYNANTGQVLLWFLNGASVIGGGSPGSAPSPWTVAGTGDFNGDGFADILWYNTTTGQVVLWLLNGASVIGGGSPGSAPSPWQIQGMNVD